MSSHARIGVLFSSGKDSTNTLWYYLEEGWEVACLLCLLPSNPDSYMFQNPHRNLVERQAASLGLPVLFQETAGEKERELDDLRLLLERAKEEFSIGGVAVGALASDYQHERITRICDEVCLKTYAPLWHKDQALLLSEMIGAGFDIRMTRIASDGLTGDWLGKRLTPEDLNRLRSLSTKNGLHPGGEGGEFETIVLDGPIFSAPTPITFEKEMESEHRGELVLHA